MYKIIAAEVLDVNFDDSSLLQNFAILCRPLQSFDTETTSNPSNAIIALPLDTNVKKMPLKHEVVILVPGPAYTSKMRGQVIRHYYSHTVSLFANVHHNQLPNTTSPENKKQAFGDHFEEKGSVNTLQPYEGDVLFEGRFGQSLRFGSTQKEGTKTYIVNPEWKGKVGSPITILRNNTFKKQNNAFIGELVNEDDGILILTTDQKIPIEKAFKKEDGFPQKPEDVKQYSQPQAILASDRIILNARKNELLFLSAKTCGIGSPTVVFNCTDKYVIDSPKIHFGKKDADEPVLLGNKTVDWLSELCSTLEQVIDEITRITVPTPVGTSGTPINTPLFVKLKTGNLLPLKNKLMSLKSQITYTK